jgi:hypothetical protein
METFSQNHLVVDDIYLIMGFETKYANISSKEDFIDRKVLE